MLSQDTHQDGPTEATWVGIPAPVERPRPARPEVGGRAEMPTFERPFLSTRLEEIRAGKMADALLDEIKRPPTRLSTGLPSWDKALKGGIMVPSLSVLGAKPKCGKSTIFTYIADNVVQAGNIVYMIDLENGGARIFRRIVSRRAELAIDEFASDELFSPTTKLKAAHNEVTEGAIGNRLYIETSRKFTEQDIEEKVSYLSLGAQAMGCNFLLMVDSLQKLPVANLSDRRAGIDGWLRYFEYLRDKYNIAIMVTSELKRPTEGQMYKPTEISLKESGDIEYTADMVITLDRGSAAGDAWIDDPPETNPIQVNVVFNRDGPSGRLRSDLTLVYPYHGIREVDATVRQAAYARR
jgi:replicative DNA helicase